METIYYDLKDFVKKINEEGLTCSEYHFYMEALDGRYEIEPVFNIYNEVCDFEIKEDNDEIMDVFSLTEILCAKYTLEEVK